MLTEYHVKDLENDKIDFDRSGILVLRVRNGNKNDIESAVMTISKSDSWNERRSRLGLKPVT